MCEDLKVMSETFTKYISSPNDVFTYSHSHLYLAWMKICQMDFTKAFLTEYSLRNRRKSIHEK